VRLPSLRRVISAGAPVSATVIERFTRMLGPDVQVHTPYGATEALPVASIGSDEILGETRKQTENGGGVCVGRPVTGMRVRIIRISDEPIPTWSDDLELPAGQIGEIAVQGPVVTRSYWNRPESTALAKIEDPALGGFYHRMGDLGYLDQHGRLWMCGRKAHRVRAERGDSFTVPCEGIFNAHPAVYRTAVVGMGEHGRARPVLCVELLPECRGQDRERIRQELLALGAAHEETRDITAILFHPSFPVDIRHNAKIFREKLAVWAARRVQ
jgi:acyl-CoA synthetase (AMP-forming)/AMP-acid ligase II